MRSAAWLGAALCVLGTAPAFAQVAAPTEYTETYKGWQLFCQVWDQPRRVECEVSSRVGTAPSRTSRILWLRSTERWLDGLRFRLDETRLDVAKGVQIWIGGSLFRPDRSCQPFPYEGNTCAIGDAAVNDRLVERLLPATWVSVAGVSPAGGKADLGFPLSGFRTAVERMEQIRADAGVRWKEP